MGNQKRLWIAAATLVVLPGCLDVSFSVKSKVSFTIDAAQASFDSTSTLDLTTNADFQSHKGNVNGVSLENAIFTITALNPGNTAVTLQSAKVTARASGAPADGSQDVVVAEVTAPLTLSDYLLAPAGGGQVYRMPLTQAQAANAFVLQNLVRGSGKATVFVKGQVAGANGAAGLFKGVIEVDLTQTFSYGLL